MLSSFPGAFKATLNRMDDVEMKMSKEEKAQFIENMYETLKTEALNKVDYMPEDWDGWELRQYMADKTSDIVWPSSSDKGRKRKYTNTIRTTGNL